MRVVGDYGTFRSFESFWEFQGVWEFGSLLKGVRSFKSFVRYHNIASSKTVKKFE